MTSITGYVTYLKYQYGTAKGDIAVDDVWNEPFKLGKTDESYTSDRTVEAITSTAAAMPLAWTPVVKGAFRDASGEAKDVKIIAADGTVTFANLDSDGKVPAAALVAGGKVAYVYDNVTIKQEALPTLKARMDGIALKAKARRIAIHYSQMSAFQAKQDYGMDIADMLAEQAVGVLSYEIDTEIVKLLAAVGDENTTVDEKAMLTWSKTLPVGVSKRDHYEGFTEIVEIGKQIMFDKTQKFAPNYMICSSSVIPVLTFIPGFTPAPATGWAGPHFAGTLNGLKVFVTPSVPVGKFYLGLNGDDMMSSVAVYAPYMPVVPTAMLQGPDGSTSQGFSTLYALEVLNKDLILAGQVTA